MTININPIAIIIWGLLAVGILIGICLLVKPMKRLYEEGNNIQRFLACTFLNVFVALPKTIIQTLYRSVVEVIQRIFFRIRLVIATILSWAGAVYVGLLLWQNYQLDFRFLISLFYVSQVVFKNVLCVIFGCEFRVRYI